MLADNIIAGRSYLVEIGQSYQAVRVLDGNVESGWTVEHLKQPGFTESVRWSRQFKSLLCDNAIKQNLPKPPKPREIRTGAMYRHDDPKAPVLRVLNRIGKDLYETVDGNNHKHEATAAELGDAVEGWDA